MTCKNSKRLAWNAWDSLRHHLEAIGGLEAFQADYCDGADPDSMGVWDIRDAVRGWLNQS